MPERKLISGPQSGPIIFLSADFPTESTCACTWNPTDSYVPSAVYVRTELRSVDRSAGKSQNREFQEIRAFLNRPLSVVIVLEGPGNVRANARICTGISKALGGHSDQFVTEWAPASAGAPAQFLPDQVLFRRPLHLLTQAHSGSFARILRILLPCERSHSGVHSRYAPVHSGPFNGSLLHASLERRFASLSSLSIIVQSRPFHSLLITASHSAKFLRSFSLLSVATFTGIQLCDPVIRAAPAGLLRSGRTPSQLHTLTLRITLILRWILCVHYSCSGAFARKLASLNALQAALALQSAH